MDAGDTMLKNKPHFVKFDHCLIVGLQTLKLTLVFVVIYLQICISTNTYSKGIREESDDAEEDELDAEDVDVDVGHGAVHGIDHVTVEVDNWLVPLSEGREMGRRLDDFKFFVGSGAHTSLLCF